jgi:hypothetical protein
MGLDPSPLAAATTSHHYTVRAIAGSFCSPPEELGGFDLVILSHVLEHIADVREAADGLTSMVNAGGLVYLEVPDAVRYPDFLVAPFHDFNNEHINHFSLQCLDTLLSARGFERLVGGGKEVPIAPEVLYPAAFGLWRKTGVVKGEIDFDGQLRTSLERYVTASEKLLGRLDARLREIQSDEPVALWGAGNLTVKLLEETALRDSNIVTIVDGSKQRQGISLNGIEVRDPMSLREFKGTVLVMSRHHATSIRNAAKSVTGKAAKIFDLLT